MENKPTFELHDTDANNDYRKLYNHNQIMKKFVDFNKNTSSDYLFLKGFMFNIAENKSPFIVIHKVKDFVSLGRVPFFGMNTNLFEFEKSNKKIGYIGWENGRLSLGHHTQEPFITDVIGSYAVESFKKVQAKVNAFNAGRHIITLANRRIEKLSDGENCYIFDDLIEQFTSLLDNNRCPRIGFCETGLFLIGNDDGGDIGLLNAELSKAKALLHTPKKFYPKFNKTDIVVFEFRHLHDQICACTLHIINKKYHTRMMIAIVLGEAITDIN